MKHNFKINGQTITATQFAFDDCHKIYLLESESDLRGAQNEDWTILPIEDIEQVYNDACPLKFINTWSLDSIVEQGEDAIFENFKTVSA